MADRIRFVEGDINRVVGVVLSNDGVAVDLSAADAIECHQRDRSTGVTTIITGLSGNASGEVSTTFASALVEGVYTLEWQVTTGSSIVTYPGDGGARPLLIVRTEAD